MVVDGRKKLQILTDKVEITVVLMHGISDSLDLQLPRGVRLSLD